MALAEDLEPLVAHLQRILPLQGKDARRAVDEVAAWFARESPEAFVRRRHRELQAQGVRNAQAFDRIAAELAARPVAGPRMTVRQVRRTIYG
jgi:hypothetical protein